VALLTAALEPKQNNFSSEFYTKSNFSNPSKLVSNSKLKVISEAGGGESLHFISKEQSRKQSLNVRKLSRSAVWIEGKKKNQQKRRKKFGFATSERFSCLFNYYKAS
jgi:hypothetical protein